IGGQLVLSLNLAPAFVIALLQPLLFAAAAAGLLALTAGGWARMSQLRAWANFASGAWLATFGGFALEVIAIGLVGFIAFIIVAAVDPAQAEQIMFVIESMGEGIIDMETITPLVLQPWVFSVALFAFAVIAPLIEELFKPVGVMLWLRRRPAPMAAFVGGVMGGLGFAVAETLGYLSNLNEAWVFNVILRLATLVMHAFTAGLVGWGWGQLAARRPMRLAAAYFGAVALHGLWNGIAVVIGFGSLYLQENPNGDSATIALIGMIILASTFVLLALVPACVAGLAFVGYRLRIAEQRSTTASSRPTQTLAEPTSAASATAGE
ncbi:MAG TPA: PrsW family glutamic-type intramembrane protease, partial [Anaerolineales bacterium]|nr:PrsW family glutamic-type intramembrane protease [Anaerolineales bacterium]